MCRCDWLYQGVFKSTRFETGCTSRFACETQPADRRFSVILAPQADAANKLTVTNSVIIENSATGGGNWGGGINNVNDGATTIHNSTISGNSAGAVGGGVYNTSGTLSIANSTITENTARFGGGILSHGGTVTIFNCMIAGNSADYGGGIHSERGSELIITSFCKFYSLRHSIHIFYGVRCRS